MPLKISLYFSVINFCFFSLAQADLCAKNIKGVIGNPDKIIWKTKLVPPHLGVSKDFKKIIGITYGETSTLLTVIGDKTRTEYALTEDGTKCKVDYKRDSFSYIDISEGLKKLLASKESVLLITVSSKMPYSLKHLTNSVEYLRNTSTKSYFYCDSTETLREVKALGLSCDLKLPSALSAIGFFTHYPSTLKVKKELNDLNIIPGLIDSREKFKELLAL